MIFMGSKSNENVSSKSGWACLQGWFVPQWILGVGAFVRRLKSWRQSHSCCLQEGVTLPSGWMFLLGLLTRTECAGPSALRSPQGRVPARLTVFRRQACFCWTKKGVLTVTLQTCWDTHRTPSWSFWPLQDGERQGCWRDMPAASRCHGSERWPLER